ncbi:hypothetical protein [Parabacteroides chongii]|uniref:hypothetical protein n=1 Tax=Parabacteroides chongii TaxID=2685834 RepID=UPI00240D8BDF|nr:hypothetical protein [Parabacteroides chongii]WFE85858.1 hypothetical protein P3L47_04465 [Parabacteroides chongii]
MKHSLFPFVILLLTSCSVGKQTGSYRQQTDSLRQISRLSIQTGKVPESRAALAVPVGTLEELPAGSAFIQKSGQATAEIHFRHDTLFVTATCDSLQTLVYQYEEQLERLSAQTQEKKKETTWQLPTLLLLLILSGLVLLKIVR